VCPGVSISTMTSIPRYNKSIRTAGDEYISFLNAPRQHKQLHLEHFGVYRFGWKNMPPSVIFLRNRERRGGMIGHLRRASEDG